MLKLVQKKFTSYPNSIVIRLVTSRHTKYHSIDLMFCCNIRDFNMHDNYFSVIHEMIEVINFVKDNTSSF